MINLCNILLPNDKVQAMPAGIGKIIKPKQVTDNVIEVDVVVEFYNFYISFWIYGFCL